MFDVEVPVHVPLDPLQVLLVDLQIWRDSTVINVSKLKKRIHCDWNERVAKKRRSRNLGLSISGAFSLRTNTRKRFSNTNETHGDGWGLGGRPFRQLAWRDPPMLALD